MRDSLDAKVSGPQRPGHAHLRAVLEACASTLEELTLSRLAIGQGKAPYSKPEARG